jgi:hypothetical protein
MLLVGPAIFRSEGTRSRFDRYPTICWGGFTNSTKSLIVTLARSKGSRGAKGKGEEQGSEDALPPPLAFPPRLY